MAGHAKEDKLDRLTCRRSCSVDGIARLDHVPASTSFLSASKSVWYHCKVERLTRFRQRSPQRLAVESAAGTRPVLVRQEATRRACQEALHVSSRIERVDRPEASSWRRLTRLPKLTTEKSVVQPSGRAIAAGERSETGPPQVEVPVSVPWSAERSAWSPSKRVGVDVVGSR
jgi:hypothetical protein